MRKFLILSLCLSLLISSAVILFPRVAGAGWSAPIGPYASDPSKPDIKDTISMSGVSSSVNSEIYVSINKKIYTCFRNYTKGNEGSADYYSGEVPCFNPPGACVGENNYYNSQCQNHPFYNYIVERNAHSEKKTVTTTYGTIKIKYKNSNSVEFSKTTSGTKEIYYYDCDNVNCEPIAVSDGMGGYYEATNPKTLTNYTYEPIPARSDVVILPLNNLIRYIGGPECSYQYGNYQNIVDCATFGLSADGRIGDARYHNSQSIDNSWWDSFVDFATSFTPFSINLVGSPGNPQGVSSVTSYGTVENSNSLGVGSWGWSGFYGNSNSGFIIPPPTLNLSTKTQYEILKPTDTANVGLSWSSTYADSCVASGDWSGSKNIGNPNAVSEYLPKPRGDYSFTLGCSGTGGSVKKTATTKVIQIPQCNFSADKSSIVLPDTATLSWNCDYVSGGSGGGCSINQNIGSVGSSGSKEIRPSKTTSYLLTCNGLDGSNSFETTVNINTPLKIKYQEVIPR